MKITYLVFALGVFCTAVYSSTIEDEENIEDGILNGIYPYS